MGLWNETLSKGQTCTSLTTWVEVPTNHGQNNCQMQTSPGKQNLVLANLMKEIKSRERQHKLWGSPWHKREPKIGLSQHKHPLPDLIHDTNPSPCMGSENDVMEKRWTIHSSVSCLAQGLVSFPLPLMVLQTSTRPHVSCLKIAWADSLQL